MSHLEPKLLSDLTPVVNEQVLWRYLGYPHGKTPENRVQKTLAEQKKVLPDLIKPLGVYGHSTGQTCFDQDHPLHDRDIVLCVVTIGGELETRAAEYASRGDILGSFVLDTLGSVYAEGVAEAAYRKLGEMVRNDRLRIGCRISPGYGKWQLSYQEKIFALLPVESIGVRLTPGLMMVPRKSVSFAAERSADPLRVRDGEQCVDCEMEDCRYRDE